MINKLNLGIGWNEGVNLRIKNLKIYICDCGGDALWFSTKIQRFFDGNCYRIGATSYNGGYGIPGLLGIYLKDTRGGCWKDYICHGYGRL